MWSGRTQQSEPEPSGLLNAASALVSRSPITSPVLVRGGQQTAIGCLVRPAGGSQGAGRPRALDRGLCLTCQKDRVDAVTSSNYARRAGMIEAGGLRRLRRGPLDRPSIEEPVSRTGARSDEIGVRIRRREAKGSTDLVHLMSMQPASTTLRCSCPSGSISRDNWRTRPETASPAPRAGRAIAATGGRSKPSSRGR